MSKKKDFRIIKHKNGTELRLEIPDNIARARSMYTAALRMARRLTKPVEDASELKRTDRYVKFFLGIRDEDGKPRFDFRTAQEYAKTVYDYLEDVLNEDALLLAVTRKFNDFASFPHDSDKSYKHFVDAELDEIMPGLRVPDIDMSIFKIEMDVLALNTLMETDKDFRREVLRAVEDLFSSLQGDGEDDMEYTGEEVDSDTGFHGE